MIDNFLHDFRTYKCSFSMVYSIACVKLTTYIFTVTHCAYGSGHLWYSNIALCVCVYERYLQHLALLTDILGVSPLFAVHLIRGANLTQMLVFSHPYSMPHVFCKIVSQISNKHINL